MGGHGAGQLFSDPDQIAQAIQTVSPNMTKDGLLAARHFAEYRKEKIEKIASRISRWRLSPNRVRKSKMVWHQWVGCLVAATRLWGATDVQESVLTAHEMALDGLWTPDSDEALLLVQGKIPESFMSDQAYDAFKGRYKYHPDSGYSMAAAAAKATGEEIGHDPTEDELAEDTKDAPKAEGAAEPAREPASNEGLERAALEKPPEPEKPAETEKPAPDSAPRACAESEVSDRRAIKRRPPKEADLQELSVRSYSKLVRRLSVEQLELRRTGITATDISAIAGLNPWKSTLDVYLDKIDTTTPELMKLNDAAEWGIMLEPFVMWRYLQDYEDATVHSFDETLKNEWMIASPDYAIDELVRRLTEIKTTSQYWEDVPRYYEAQVHWQWGVMTDLGWDLDQVVHIPCFSAFRGFDFVVWEVEIDLQFLEQLKDLGRDFWVNHVLKKEPPRLEGSSAAMARMFPADEGAEYAKSTPEAERLLGLLPEWIRRAEIAQSGIDKIYAKLQGEIKKAPGMAFKNGHRLTWKAQKGRKKTQWQGVVGEIVNRGLVEQKVIDEIIEKNTSRGKGSRPWKPNVKGLLKRIS